MKFRFVVVVFVIMVLLNFVSAFLISDQGTNVKNVSTGNLTELANLTISIYDNLTGGSLIFEQNFSDTIVNGSWNVMINPNLEYGKSYYKDYRINGEDLDFDGNERLRFQSSVGGINNVSFINFSLVSSCSAGSSIRLIYNNGSVECETDDDFGSPDLTDYALKNQSEVFVGDITTSQSGFFGWLGSLVSRITKLFVQDIDFNGTINGSGDINITGNVTASYFMGDGSLLINLPAGSGDNSSWNETYADTLYAVAGAGNSSWNQTLATTLYYGIDNPSSYYNSTDFSIGDYVLDSKVDSLGNYSSENSTIARIGDCPSGQFVQNTTTGGVECLVPTLSESDPLWTANQSNYFNTTDIIAFGYYNSSDFVITNYFTKSDIEGFDYYNSTDFSIADYFTSAEVLAFNYYNSSDFDINDYLNLSILFSFNYYNSSDFDINDYATDVKVDSLGNWSNDKGDYSTTTEADALYRAESWDNITGIPTATPSNGDTTHFSLAGEIYSWIMGLNYITNAVGDLANYYLKTETYTKAEVDANLSLYRLDSWDNFTGIPTASPSDGDTTHLSTADQIRDWVIGLAYLTAETLWNGNFSAATGTGNVVLSDSPTFTTAITVPANSISDDEINEDDTFEWTAVHSWTAAVDFGGDVEFNDEIRPDNVLCDNGDIIYKTGADNWDCKTIVEAGAEPISTHLDASTTVNITCFNSPICDWYANATDSCMYWPSGGKDCGAA